MKIIEMSSNNVNGRRTAKVVLHEIFADNTTWQDNGISWNEEYTINNMATVNDMSITAEFDPWYKREPAGHGFTGVNKDGNPEFEGASVVGHAYNPKIETIDINGRATRVLTAKANLDEMRYPRFIEWLFEQYKSGINVKGSVEIVGKTPGTEIVYRDGWKEKGRVPMDYSYSGYAFLTIQEADHSSIMLELSNNTMKQKKEENKIMNEKEIMAKFDKLEETLNKMVETNAKNDGDSTVKDKEITELNAKIEALTKTVSEKDAQITELNTKLSEQTTKITEQNTKIENAEKSALIAELNGELAKFTAEQKEIAKTQIEAFTANPVKTEINSIVAVIKCAIADKLIENANKVMSEQNAFGAKTKNTLNDIFGSVEEPKKDVETGGLF